MKTLNLVNALVCGAVLALAPVARAQGESDPLQGSVTYSEPAPVLQAETPLYDNSLTGGEASPVLDDASGGIDPAGGSKTWTTADCWGTILPRDGGADAGGDGLTRTANCWGKILSGTGSDAESEPAYAPPMSDDQAVQALTGHGPTRTNGAELNISGSLGFITIQESVGYLRDTDGRQAFVNTFKFGITTNLIGASVGNGVSTSEGDLAGNLGWSDYAGASVGEVGEVNVGRTWGNGNGTSMGAAFGGGVGLVPGVGFSRGASFTNSIWSF